MTVTMIVIILLIFAGSSLVKGWAGFGTNLLALPLLLLIDYPKYQAVTIVMTVNIFLNLAILFENKKFRFEAIKEIWQMIVVGGIFTFLGNYYLSKTNQQFFMILVGSVIILFVLNKVFHPSFTIKRKERYYIPVGVVSGLLNGLAGLGGLPALLLLSNSDMPRDKFKSTLVTYFLMMNGFVVISSIINGYYSPFVITNIIWVAPLSIVITLLGVYLSRRVSETWFSRSMLVVLFALGVNLIIQAL